MLKQNIITKIKKREHNGIDFYFVLDFIYRWIIKQQQQHKKNWLLKKNKSHRFTLFNEKSNFYFIKKISSSFSNTIQQRILLRRNNLTNFFYCLSRVDILNQNQRC